MFAMTLSGRMIVELNPPSRELADVTRVLDRLDGDRRFSIVVFPLPDGARLDDINTDSYVSGYLQCAGSSDRLTIELRQDVDGEYRQYAIAPDARVAAPRSGRGHPLEHIRNAGVLRGDLHRRSSGRGIRPLPADSLRSRGMPPSPTGALKRDPTP